MKSMSAAEAKNGFGQLIDIARQEPVKIEKHGRAVVVVVSIEEFERLSSLLREPQSSVAKQQGEE